MARSVTMTYGEYSFSPVPIINFSKEIVRDGAGNPICIKFAGTLTGTLLGYPDKTGIASVLELQSELSAAFDCSQCKRLSIICTEDAVDTVLLSVFPQVNNIQFSETSDNWVFSINYSIDLEWFGTATECDQNPPFVETVSDTWSISIDEATSAYNLTFPDCPKTAPTILRVEHNLNAVGKNICESDPLDPMETGAGVLTHAWEYARDWVVDHLGFDENCVFVSGFFEEPASYELCNHIRTNSIDKTAGSFTATESWTLLTESGVTDNVLEDFTVNTDESCENGLTTISLNGTITGLNKFTYDPFTVVSTKFESAENFWTTLQTELFCRATGYYEGPCVLNPTPVTFSHGKNPAAGTISYNVSYNDRPISFISGACFESIQFSETNAHSIIAEVPAIGRARGPILQDLNTVSRTCRNVAIEVVMSPTGCANTCEELFSNSLNPKAQVEVLLCCWQQDLQNTYEIVHKTADTESWDPFRRRYSRNIQWCYQSCNSGDAPATSFC